MTNSKNSRQNKLQRQYLLAIDGSLALTAVLLVVQMWLLTASLEASLSGHREAALPGALFSGFVCL